MPPIFLATLGQRPEAITMALDVLLSRYHYEMVGLLHTDAERSGIRDAYAALTGVLQRDYGIAPVTHPLQHVDGTPLIDIVDQHSAEIYYRAVLTVLKRYRQQGEQIHLLVAGGRKAMSIYATLAAGLVFSEYDRVWTVLADRKIMKPGLFHAPAGYHDAVQVVNLPLLPSRLLPGVLVEQDVDAILALRDHPRDRFLALLTGEETTLIELLQVHPYATNKSLAGMLDKSRKTVENQFGSIYSKLQIYFEAGADSTHKRRVLLDVLAGKL